MTTEELAESLGVARQTVNRWIRQQGWETEGLNGVKGGRARLIFEGNDVGIQFVNLPGAMPLDFFGTVFSGNGTDIDNPIQNPIDLSNAIFE